MARTINSEEEIKDVNPEVQNGEHNEEQDEKEATKAGGRPRQATVVASQTKKVKVRASEEIDCMIANTPYKLAKDKEHLIPSDVAAILVNSGKAYRL